MIATIILIAINVMSLGVVLALHGKEKEGKYNFWLSLIATAFIFFLYYKAGLFNVFKD